MIDQSDAQNPSQNSTQLTCNKWSDALRDRKNMSDDIYPSQ